MSNKKIEKPAGELISQVDVGSKKISAEPSRCSCVNCDFIGCSENRKKPVKDQDKKSQCDNCKNLKECALLHDSNIKENKLDLETKPKRVIREIVTRETIQRLKRVTETMYDFDNNQNLGMIAERQSKLSKNTEVPTSIISNTTEWHKKSSTDNENSNKDECCRNNLVSQSNISSKKIPTPKKSISCNNIDCCKENTVDDKRNIDNNDCCGNNYISHSKTSIKKMTTPNKNVISNNIECCKKSSFDDIGYSDKNIWCGAKLSSQNNISSKNISAQKKNVISNTIECYKENSVESNGNSNKNVCCKSNFVSKSNISSKKLPTPNKSVISNNIECCMKSSVDDKQNSDKNEFCRKSLVCKSNISTKRIPTPNKSAINNNIECCKKNPIDDKAISEKNECWRKNLVSVSNITSKNESYNPSQVPDIDVGQLHKEDNTATELSAQVMNVPYEDLHESVLSTHEVTKQNPLSKIKLFKRIKEIYEACSCKVCECISSTPRDIRDNFCKCKPCQCQDCVKSRKKIEEDIRRISHPGCPCIRCDRSNCQDIVKNTCALQVCDCNPSDSYLYPEELIKECKCEPCECVNCRLFSVRTSKTVKLGQVDEIIQKETCHCSPCECIDCQNIFKQTNPTFMTTYSTDRSKYCNHDRYNNNHTARYQLAQADTYKREGKNEEAMRKSFKKKKNDYDIRTVIIDNNGFLNQQKGHNFENHNTVTMYSCLSPNLCKKYGVCKCTECECIVCSNRNDSQNYREHLKNSVMVVNNNIMPTPITNACKCTPCECEICSKTDERNENSIEFERSNKCTCNVCDCLNCDNASLVTSSFLTSSFNTHCINDSQTVKRIKSLVVNKNCDCNACHCSNCKKLFSCSSSVKYYSNGKCVERNTTRRLKKVMLITPTSSENHLKTRETYIRNISATSLSPKNSIDIVIDQDLSTCHAISDNFAPITHLPSKNKEKNCDFYQNNEEYSGISNDDFDRSIFFHLNNPISVTSSFKSIEEPQVLNYPLDYTFKPHKTDNQNRDLTKKEKLNSFHINLNKTDKIPSNNSNESLPVYWACRNETHLPSTTSRNIKTKRTDLINEINDHFYKTKYSKIKQNEINQKGKESKNQFFKDNDELKFGENFTKNFKNSCCTEKHIDAESISLRQKTCICTNLFSSTNRNSNKGYSNSVLNKSDVTIDYENASRVLLEAKAFSSKLIKMLDSFETANRQFESASQKFKILHKSLLNINESETKSCGTNVENNFDDNFANMSESSINNRPVTGESNKNENEAEREYEQITAKSEELSDNLKYTQELQPTNFATTETNNIDKTNTKINNMIAQQSQVDNINVTQESNFQFEKAFNKSDERFPTCISSYLHVSDSATFNLSQVNKEIMDKNRPSLTSEINFNDSVLGNNISTGDSAVTNDIENDLVQSSKQEYKQSWPIFKKNLYLNTCPTNKKTIFETSPLEIDIKEAIQAISLQDNEHKIISRPNEALANLQSEVNDLLNMPLLQPTSKYKFKAEPEINFFPRNKFNLEVRSMSSTASSQTYEQVARADKEVYFNNNLESRNFSCEQFKATFVGLRRISDHTVLVRWNVPTCIQDVQGYELLVDGRAVQQIFSPRRSMAVVTCLPHATRVLLTIRTVTSAGVDCGHAPSTSVVYRPRMK